MTNKFNQTILSFFTALFAWSIVLLLRFVSGLISELPFPIYLIFDDRLTIGIIILIFSLYNLKIWKQQDKKDGYN